jgi:hypothetical protein
VNCFACAADLCTETEHVKGTVKVLQVALNEEGPCGQDIATLASANIIS